VLPGRPGGIAVNPLTDGAAILRRVLSEPITDDHDDADTAG
jgi:hypothetical protein